MKQRWLPRNKYEVAPGLFIGSEIGDIDREIKVLMKKWLDGNEEAFSKMQKLQDRRLELIAPKIFQKQKGLFNNVHESPHAKNSNFTEAKKNYGNSEFKSGFLSGLTMGIMVTILFISISVGLYLVL